MILDSAASFGIQTNTTDTPAGNRLLAFTAYDSESARRGADECSRFVVDHPKQLNDAAYTLGLRREHLAYRTYAVVNGGDLQDIKFSTPVKSSAVASNISFVFTGQGAQWPTMGSALLSEYPAARDDLTIMEKSLSELGQDLAPTWTLSGM